MKFHRQIHLIRKQYFMYYQLSQANILNTITLSIFKNWVRTWRRCANFETCTI